MNVTTAVANRRSTRDFLSKPVPLALVQEILNTALRAPSGGNTQPWHLYIVAGQAKTSLSNAAKTAMSDGTLAGGASAARTRLCFCPAWLSNTPPGSLLGPVPKPNSSRLLVRGAAGALESKRERGAVAGAADEAGVTGSGCAMSAQASSHSK